MSLGVISISTQANKEILLIMAYWNVATSRTLRWAYILNSSMPRHGTKAKVPMGISGKFKINSQVPWCWSSWAWSHDCSPAAHPIFFPGIIYTALLETHTLTKAPFPLCHTSTKQNCPHGDFFIHTLHPYGQGLSSLLSLLVKRSLQKMLGEMLRVPPAGQIEHHRSGSAWSLQSKKSLKRWENSPSGE